MLIIKCDHIVLKIYNDWSHRATNINYDKFDENMLQLIGISQL